MVRQFVTVLAVALALGAAPAFAQTKVPPGNRSVEQPPIPGGSANRTAAMRTTYEAKYRKVFNLLANDKPLRDKIVSISGRYGLDPMHMVGAIVGEHTYNVDAYDRLQTYYVKAISYLNSSFTFGHGGETVDEFVQRPEFERCASRKDSLALWTCREQVWDQGFRGKTVGDKRFPDDRFGAVFFQPFFAGQTFGLGQVNPLTALMMSDRVHKTGGLAKLDHRDAQGVYRTIMDPDQTLHYVAAVLQHAIETYKAIAGFDISRNPGVTATLYNVGGADRRAAALKRENDRRRAAGQSPRLPQENYYGWLVNDRLDDLKALF